MDQDEQSSSGLLIGLIVGGVALALLVGVGVLGVGFFLFRAGPAMPPAAMAPAPVAMVAMEDVGPAGPELAPANPAGEKDAPQIAPPVARVNIGAPKPNAADPAKPEGGKSKAEGGVTLLSLSGKTTAGQGDRSYGVCGAAIWSVDHQPVVAFGITKSRGQKETYRYFIVYKAAPGDRSKAAAFGASGRETAVESDVSAKLLVGAKEITQWQFQFKADEATQKVLHEALTIHGQACKLDEGRVFLVDLTASKPVCRSVKAALPTDVPTFAGKEPWLPIVQRALANLQADSPEIKKFLE